MSTDLQELISGYLNGDLSAEDDAALRRRLASDPAALTEFVEAMDLHAGLRKIYLEGQGRSVALEEIRRSGKSGAWKWVASFAAVAAIAGLTWVLATAPKPVARLESATGQVRLIAGDSKEAKPGQNILAGQGLEIVGEGRATVALQDGTTLELGSRTRVQEFAPRGENRIVVAQGKLSAEVARQPSDRPLVFATVHGEAKVLGTSLKLVVDPDLEKGSTRLEVTEGRVQLTRRVAGDSVEVAAGHYAVVAKARAPESRTLTAERVRQMPPGTWLALPRTQLRQALPDAVQFPKVAGLRDPKGIMNSWSGGVLDPSRNRLVVWGGGHVNYAGNEVYAFDLESLAWERLTDPTSDPAVGAQVNPDGTPVARATYNGLACIAHADRMFALGGDLAPNGGTPDITWTFDFAANAWENRNPSGDRPPSWVGCASAYDPATRKVWWGEGRGSNNTNGGLYSYDFDANRWTKHAEGSFYYQTMAVDSRRGVLVCLGNGKIFSYDIRGSGPIVRQPWRTTGGDALIAKQNPGFDYDASSDRLVAWAGGAVSLLDPETKVWEHHDAPGPPKPTTYGIFGRWRYVPSLNVCVVVTGVDENVYFYKLPDKK